MDAIGISNKSLKLLRDLHEYSFALAGTDDCDIFKFVVEKAALIFGIKAAFISKYDYPSEEFTVCASSFTSEDLSKAFKFMGKRLVGMKVKSDTVQFSQILQEKVCEPTSMKNIAFHSIPDILCSSIEKMLGIGWFIGIALENNGKLLGTIMLVGNNGQTPPERDELLIFRAITSSAIAKKDAEKKLIESEKLHRSISENSFDLVCLTDTAGQYIYCNSSYYDILGYSNDELMNLEPFSLVHPEDMELAVNTFRKGVAELRSDSIILRLLCKNGAFKWVEHRAKGIFNENGELKAVLINGQDVTERKKFEEALIKAKNEAESASLAKSDFLANMSHELRTPLCGVIGFSDLLESTTVLDPTQKEYIRSLKSSASMLMNLINDTLDLRKIETGKLEMKPEKTDLKVLFEEVSASLYPLAKGKGLKTVMVLPDEMPRYVTVDPLRLKQILLNLTGNAIKFTEKGAVSISVKTIGEKNSGGKCTFAVSVSDTGIGIETDKHSKITESFYQVDSSSTRKYGGSGLGLAITEKLLELMGSRLEISSIPGKGSTFSFKMELPEADSSEMLPAEKTDKSGKLTAAPVKALIVDDNSLNLFLTSKILKLALPEIEVFHAEDGTSAINSFKKVAPDLILLDIQMPDMNGFDVARSIRSAENGSRSKIIAVSADVMKCDEKMCLETGIDGYISKPFTKTDLAEAITKVFFKK
ncbi:MAG TPA: ATP-binding protein [bacterium]|nr:ATP-binding protein [bacterium]